MSAMKRWKTLLAGAILLSGSTLVALLLAELAVRVAAPQQLGVMRPDVWQPADTVGWTFRPGIDITMNTGERDARILTDRDGFRVGARGRLAGDRTVLLLGDSFMAALQVDHEESLAGLMEAGLPSMVGATVAVRNAGVVAWDPPQYLLRARSLLGREPYDLVLVAVYLGNDVVDTALDYFAPREPVARLRVRVPRGLGGGEVADALVRPVDQYLRERSHLHVLLRNQLQFLRMRLGLSSAYFPEGLRIQEADEPRWAFTADLLAEIQREAEAHGIPTLFVLIPSDFQVDTALLDAHAWAFGIELEDVDLEQPNRLLRREMEARGLEVVDALPALREAFARGVYGYGRVDSHFSPEGHRVTWELLAPRLAEILSRPSEGSDPAHR